MFFGEPISYPNRLSYCVLGSCWLERLHIQGNSLKSSGCDVGAVCEEEEAEQGKGDSVIVVRF